MVPKHVILIALDNPYYITNLYIYIYILKDQKREQDSVG